jgi:hypothetical protein
MRVGECKLTTLAPCAEIALGRDGAHRIPLGASTFCRFHARVRSDISHYQSHLVSGHRRTTQPGATVECCLTGSTKHHDLMADTTGDEDTMATLNAAKQQLRAAMKHKLKAVSHDSIVSQSMAPQPRKSQQAN